MKLFVKTFDNIKHNFDVNKEITISLFKDIICDKLCLNKNQIRLLYKGFPLIDERTIKELNFSESDIIHLLTQLF
jgi:hypothetical protein